MKLKQVMKNIREMRKLTAVGMALMLGITPSYLSQIESKGIVPTWFVDRLTKIFNLNYNEVMSLEQALNDIYKSAGEDEGLRRRVKKLLQECIAKLYALFSSIFTGNYEESKQAHNEIVQILDEMKKCYERNTSQGSLI